MELHYSITKKGEGMRYHGTFRYLGSLTKAAVKPTLVKAIGRKWKQEVPFEAIEKLECYYFEKGEEISIQ
jgi:hypothetical protein